MSKPEVVHVRIELATGSAVAALHPQQAPTGTAQFLSLVDQGHYDGAHIYRRVRTEDALDDVPGIDVVQFGLALKYANATSPAAPILHEPTTATGLRHVRGSLSFARVEPGSATSEVFVTLRESPELDYGGRRQPDGQGFAVFGRVIEGLELFEAVHRIEPVEFFAKPIEITRISRVERVGLRP